MNFIEKGMPKMNVPDGLTVYVEPVLSFSCHPWPRAGRAALDSSGWPGGRPLPGVGVSPK